MESTLYSVGHIERLSTSLHQIMDFELKRPLPVEICLRVVCAGISLFRKSDLIPDTYCGRPWSTTSALYRLAGEGYLFDPRSALEAIEMLEARHIVDRRRVEHRSEPRGNVPVGRAGGRRRFDRAA
jgi:hypothetical protein